LAKNLLCFSAVQWINTGKPTFNESNTPIPAKNIFKYFEGCEPRLHTPFGILEAKNYTKL